MFCKTLGHFSSRCPTYVTVKDRAAAVKDIHGSEPCYGCLIRHKPSSTWDVGGSAPPPTGIFADSDFFLGYGTLNLF